MYEVIQRRNRELILAKVESLGNQIEGNKQIADGTLAEDEIDDMSEQDSDSQITEGSSSQDKSDFTSEYDSDSQEQVANGTMVDNVMDELSHFVCCGCIKSITRQRLLYC